MNYSEHFFRFLLSVHSECVEELSAIILPRIRDERKNKYTKITLCLVSICFFFSTHPFSYDSAIYAAQKGDIKSADEQLRSIVVNAPDDPDVLYDAGVLAYELHNYSQAAAYFNRSAQCADNKNKNLCFRAHFNAGNAYVDNKELALALQHYNDALAIEPDNEYARHNRDRVEQMLQQEEQQKDNEQKKDNQQDQKDDKNKKENDDQHQDDQSGNKNEQQDNDNGDDGQEGDNQKGNNGSRDDGSDKNSDGKQGKNDQDTLGQPARDPGNKDQEQNTSGDNKEGNGHQGLDKKFERGENNQDDQGTQHDKHHEKAPQKQDGSKLENSIPSEDKKEQGEPSQIDPQEVHAGDAGDDQHEHQGWGKKLDDPWLTGILDGQELQDKAMNKKLMEARIRQHGGKNGQNCW